MQNWIRTAISSVLALSLVLGCGGEDPGTTTTDPPKPPWKNTAPKLLMATPDQLAVGETFTVLGQDFIDKTHGYPVLVIKGKYYDSAGNVQDVDIQDKATLVNAGKLTWSMWPNIVFDRTGDHLGSFVGNVAVINVGRDGSQMSSERLPVKITIKPSVVLRIARPTNSNCQSVVNKTLEKTPFAFTAEVVGLRAASKENPLNFFWTFLAQQWNVSWSYGSFDPSTVFPKEGAFVIEDRLTSGRVSVISDAATGSFLVRVGSDLLGSSKLKELRTVEVTGQGSNYLASVSVVATDAGGKSAKLSFNLDVSRMARMTYDGNSKIVERFPPVLVSDCIPGNDIGRQLTYSEDSSETRSRAISFNYNANIGANFAPIPSNPFALGINFSVGFGVDINASVSSTKSKGLNISGQVLPGEYAVFYRQTTKTQREAQIIIRNICGEEASAGKAVLTDWLFTPELATGPSCIPPSNLPKPGKFY